MANIKKINPTTPGQRQRIAPTFDELTASKPYKPLLEVIKKTGGRNDAGHRTMRYRGGGHKRRYRIIDFYRTKTDVSATVLTIEYDPNRTARIALIEYADGVKSYIIAPQGLKVGATIASGEKVAPEIGNTLP
jgi:large subunit ribosomal protein L2